MGRICAALFSVLLGGGCGGAGAFGDPCQVDGECPVHQYCASGGCFTGCLSDETCGSGLACDAHGRCVAVAIAKIDAVASINDASAPQNDAGASEDLGEPDLAQAEVPDLVTLPRCGDGVRDPDEACDRGADNSDDPSSTSTCTTRCRVRASCGALTGSQAARIDAESGHCYVAWAAPVVFAAAQRACLERGGQLVSLSSADENQVARALAGAQVRWIGLRRPVAGALRWVTGESVDYKAFATGEPDQAGGQEECGTLAADGWRDAPCGFPTSGGLPASPASTAGYLCEHACGNGAVEPGEECDPPGATCTSTCRTVRACAEAGAVSSKITGHCYFAAGPNTNFENALAACPSGTHLATLDGPEETEAASAALADDQECWIALRAAAAGQFAWQRNGEDFASRRYHGFAAAEPNGTNLPDCVRVTEDGWKDTGCGNNFPHLCERE